MFINHCVNLHYDMYCMLTYSSMSQRYTCAGETGGCARGLIHQQVDVKHYCWPWVHISLFWFCFYQMTRCVQDVFAVKMATFKGQQSESLPMTPPLC